MARVIFLVAFIFSVAISSAQVREIPLIVKDTFAVQYPTAEEVKYEDNLVSVHVHFILNGEKQVAAYSNKGKWKETEKEWNYDKVPDSVKDGFRKSKYAEWKVVDAKIIYRPAGVERYRIKVEKNDVIKRYLFFNKEGRLTDDSITL